MSATQTEENLSMCEHLIRRGSRYSIRRRIPQDLINHYGKHEIIKALGTSEFKEAVKRCRIEAVRLDLEWDTVRAKLAGQTPSPLLAQSTAQEIADFERDQHENNLLAAQDAIEQDALEEKHAIDQVIQHHGLSGLLALSGVNLGPAIGLPATNNTPALATPTKQTLGSKTPTVEVLALWERERPRQQRTMDAKRAELGRYSRMTGIDHIESITKASVRAFRDKMLSEGASAKNTNKYLDSLRALLNFAVSEDLIPSNPANGVKANISAREMDERQPFPLTALNTIFSSPVYSANARPLGGAGEASYWLPLLGLYTGARLEELGQLHPNDVYEESTPDESMTAWVIRITDGEGQSLKNVSSRRRIPVHPALINLGFIEYAVRAKSEKRYRLFDKLKLNKYGKHTDAWSKWFSRYLRHTCGITDTSLVFHSFRHTFKDYCRAASIPEDVHDSFTGHTSDSVARSYGGEYPLAPLVSAINKFKISGLITTPKALV